MNTITIELSAEDRARLDAILEALKTITAPAQEAQENAGEAKKPEPVKVSPEAVKPAKKATEATEATEDAKAPKPAPAHDRRTIKSLAVKKIQAGHRDEVKALIQAYGAEKIDLVPEDKLVAFVADLEQIGG